VLPWTTLGCAILSSTYWPQRFGLNVSDNTLDPNSTFGWRALADYVDLTADGVVDMVPADGRSPNSSGYADV